MKSLNLFCISFLMPVFYCCLFSQSQKVTQEFIDSISATPSMYWNDPFEFWHHPEKYGVDPQKLKKYLEANPDLKGWHIYYSRVAHMKWLQKNKEMDSALHYAEKAINAYEILSSKESVNWDQLMLMYYLVSKAKRSFQRDFDASTESMLTALKLAKKESLRNWEGICYSGIGTNHFNLGNDSIALSYFKLASKDTLHMSNPRASISINAIMGSIYNKMGYQDLAKRHIMHAINTSGESDFKLNLFALYGALADIYNQEAQQDSIRYAYSNAIRSYENYNMKSVRYKGDNLYLYNLYKAFFLLEEGHLDQVITYTTKAIENCISMEKINVFEKNAVIMAADLLGKAYERKGDAKQYSELLTTVSTYLDRFHKQKLEEGMERLEIKYQTKEKDLSIAQLEESRTQQDAIIEQQRIINFGIIGLFILSVVAAVLLWRQRKLKNMYEKESLEQRLLRAQMHPHFTFNTLSVINNMIDKNPKKAKQYLIKFSRLLASIFESSTVSYVMLKTELKNLQAYIDLQQIRIPDTFEFELTLNGIDTESIYIPGMILQPIIENSISHGFIDMNKPGKITMELNQEKSLISCRVEDNGSGLKATSIAGRQSSTQLISDFLKKVTKSGVTIFDKKNTFNDQKGVIVTFSIPYKLSLYD